MAKITIEELYRGEKYDIMSAVTARALRLGIDERTEEGRTWIEMEPVRQTLIAAEQMKKTVTVLLRKNSVCGHRFLMRRTAMKTIDELWYGNISPFEQCTRGDKRLKELLKLVARNREELDGTLTDKQKETLEKFEECMNEMHGITERDAFSYGFRLGVQLMAEAFLLSIGEDG